MKYQLLRGYFWSPKLHALTHYLAVIEVPEKGKAVQFGRFNQGGEISIF